MVAIDGIVPVSIKTQAMFKGEDAVKANGLLVYSISEAITDKHQSVVLPCPQVRHHSSLCTRLIAAPLIPWSSFHHNATVV